MKLPWNYPGFLFLPERYYVGMWMIKLGPEFHPPYGGDTTFQLWRFDREPATWTVTFRFRYYIKPNDPNSNDRRNWWAMQITTPDESEAQFKARQAVRMVSGLAVATYLQNAPIDYLDIRGDCQKFAEMKKPDWLHTTGTAKVPKKKA